MEPYASYQVKANRKKAWIISLILFAVGLLLVFARNFGLKSLTGAVAFAGFGLIIAAILIANRYLMTNYLYEIELEPNALSNAPKLNIYGSRGHNYGHQFYCIPLDKCYEVKKTCKAKLPGNEKAMQTINCCGSMSASDVYLVIYDCDGKKQGTFLECDEAFAEKIRSLLTREESAQ